MANESLEGCPRCSDYDEVVEELKKEKDTREQKAKSESSANISCTLTTS